MLAYADADFAGDRPSMRSTTGTFLMLDGPHTKFPLAARSARQTCVSHSTPEAEIVAADTALRLVGLPSLDLWDLVRGELASLVLCEDNAATILVCESRKSSVRHLGRTHKVQIAWLYERFTSDPQLTICKEVSAWQRANMFTKPFRDAPKWQWVRRLIGVGPRKEGAMPGGLPLAPFAGGGNVPESLVHADAARSTQVVRPLPLLSYPHACALMLASVMIIFS